MDPIHAGSQKVMVKDEILCHKGRSGLYYQELACTMAPSNRKTNHEDRNNAVLQAQGNNRNMIIMSNKKYG